MSCSTRTPASPRRAFRADSVSTSGLKPEHSPFFLTNSRGICARHAVRQPAEVLILIYRGPWLRRDSRIRPEEPAPYLIRGRATGSRAFFDSTRMYCRKTPRSPRTRRAAPGATDGGEGMRLRGTAARMSERPCAARMGRKCFLLVTFSLHKQRKVTRSRQRAKPKAERKSSTIAATSISTQVATCVAPTGVACTSAASTLHAMAHDE